MKIKISKLLLGVAVSACVLIAVSTSASACFWSYYQPEEPNCIRK